VDPTKLTVLGGDGGFPSPGGACSGYLVEQGAFHLLLDPGYATFPALTRRLPPEQVDAVVVSHGHPDHCADLNPLLRARALGDAPARPLPVHALPGALDAVLHLDRPGMLDRAYVAHEFHPGDEIALGPLRVVTFGLPHFVPSAGFRILAGDEVLAFTGDTGPSPELPRLARGADLLLAEATYVDEVPADDGASLSSARQAGELAARAKTRRLLLTHVWPGTDRDALEHAARRGFSGAVASAQPGHTVDLTRTVHGHEGF
jgi:ribonuclease BN (tRNA processing enzyme)